MALTTEQKVDLLLKKLGYTKTKTGSVFGTGAVSGTGKQPFGEAIPSPLIVANGSLWNESDSIPATPPGSDTNQVKRYPTTSALRMTLDTTVTPNRSFIAYTTYNNTSSARLTNWIDTQFGPDYQLEVYVDDATDPANKLPEGGSGSNDGWYFDYSAGVLNFSDTNLPSGVNGAGTNVYIVGYRYVGQTGAPTPGISTYSFLDLTVERNLDVGNQGGISTFRNGINALDIIKGYKYTAAPYSGTTTTLNVTVASKVSGEHRYHGQGSALGYVIDGLQSPFFTLTPGRTYRFDQSDSSNTNHQIKFYLESDKTTLYEEGVTYSTANAGSSGAYTQIVVSDKTPVVLHYQCVNHGYMGNAFQTNANVVNTNHEATLRGGLNVTGVSTFSSLVDINAGGQANTFKVEDLTDNRIVIAGSGGELEDSANLTFNGTTLGVTGDATFSGNVSIGGTLTYEDVVNVDAVGIITARSGIDVTGGVIEALAGENKIPSLYANMAALPNAGTYHGMFAHVHSQGKGYFAHGGAWYELVNKELNGTVGVGTEVYNIGVTSISTLNVLGVSTFAGNVDINADIDVDGHTNLDNVNVAGVTTFAGIIEGIAGENKIPSLYSDIPSLPNAGTYHGMFAHVHATGRGYFSHAGGWYELVNKETNGTVGTGTETYNIGSLTATGIDLNGDIDVDGHANLDNVSIAGVTTTAGLLDINAGGQANTFKVEDLTSGRVVLAGTGGELEDTNNLRFDGTDLYVSGIRVGSGGGGIIGDDIITRNLKVNGISTFIGIATFNNATFHGDIDVDGHTNLDNISVAGVTTFAGNIDANGSLDVDGTTDLDVLNVADAATFSDNARFNSTIAVHDGTTGSNGQYLKSIGTGVTWASFPTLRTRDTVTASAGQTTFTFNYTVNFIDVYVNGIKLTDSEFTATNGTSVVLAVGCFVGDIVELVGYNPITVGSASGSLNNIVEDTTPQLGGNLDLFNKTIEGTGGINITGVVTATNFIGDGSGLTGITASGSGVIIRDNNSLIGTASTINFGDNLSVSPIVAGVVTVTATNTQLSTEEVQDIVGGMFSGNTETNITATYQDADGTIDLVVDSGVTVANQADNRLITATGTTDALNAESGLTYNGSTLALTGGQTISGDLDVDGHTELDNVNVAGVVTATTFKGAVQATSGTFSSNVDITGDLDVDGHTDLDNVSVAGVTTFSDDVEFKTGGTTIALLDSSQSRLEFQDNMAISFGNQPDVEIAYSNGNDFSIVGQFNGSGDLVTGFRNNSGNILKTFNAVRSSGSAELYFSNSKKLETTTKGIQVGTGVTIETNGQATYTGIVTAFKFIGDGSGLTGVSGSGSGIAVKNSGSVVGTAGTIDFGNGLDVTAISAGIVTVSTATTSITSGNSKVFVNDESTTSNNGSFEIFLSNSTTSGAAHTAFRIYNPSSNTNSAEFFHENNQIYSNIALKATYAAGASQAIYFRTNNSNFEGSIVHSTGVGELNFYNRYNGTTYNPFRITTQQIYTQAPINPLADNTYDLGYSVGGTNLRWRQIHATNVNAGVVTATTFHGDGSNLTGISGSGGVTVQDEGSTLSTQASTLNFVGSGVVASGTGATKTITINTGSGGVSLTGSTNNQLVTVTGANAITGESNLTFDGSTLDVNGGITANTINLETNGINLTSSYSVGVSALGLYVNNTGNTTTIASFLFSSGCRLMDTNGSTRLATSTSGVDVTGTLTATTFSGSGALLTNLQAANLTGTLPAISGANLTNLPSGTPTTSDIQVTYEITNQTSFSYYRFAGNGVDSSANNPDIYLERGQKYRFINNSGGTSHPFEIQTTGGSAYNTGVTNNGASTGSASKNIDFAVRWDAPAQLKYQCTNHGSMQGNIYISGGDEGRSTTSAATGSIAQAAYADITIPTTGKTFALLKIAISAPAWVILYTDTSSRTSDAAGTGSGRSEGTDPTPGSGVLAEVSTTTSGASTFKMTPGLIGWNDDGTPAAQIYARVYNKRATSGSNAITVTLTSVIMEV